jgi:hypothetical protein
MKCLEGIRERVLMAKGRLDQAQIDVVSSRGKATCVARASECLSEYTSVTLAEEDFLNQKSRNNWLNLGDKNTSYFHKLVKVRNSKNTISHVWDAQGRKVEEVEQIKRVAEDYYKGLLSTNSHVFEYSMIDRIGGLVTTRLSEVQARDMESDPFEVDIKSTLFAMSNNKALGPDGFSAGFFKAAWAVVGLDVIAKILPLYWEAS